MKIRCIYNKNGCEEISLLDNLDKHEKSCRFVKRICESCRCDQSTGRNCIKILLDSKEKLAQINIELQNKLKSAEDKISNMETEIENYLRTLQELTDSIESKEMCETTKMVKYLFSHLIKKLYNRFYNF
jgi:DNA repair ATPase RecN